MRVNQLFSVGTYHTDLRYGWNLVLFDTETSTGTIKPYGTTFCKYPPGLIESCTHTNFPQSPWEKAVYSIFCNFKMAAWWTFDTIEFHTCLTASIAYSIWCIRPCSKISWSLWKGLYLGVYLGQADQHAHHSFCFFHYNCCGNIPCEKTFWSQEITTLEIWTPRGLIFHQNKMWLAGTKKFNNNKKCRKMHPLSLSHSQSPHYPCPAEWIQMSLFTILQDKGNVGSENEIASKQVKKIWSSQRSWFLGF